MTTKIVDRFSATVHTTTSGVTSAVYTSPSIPTGASVGIVARYVAVHSTAADAAVFQERRCTAHNASGTLTLFASSATGVGGSNDNAGSGIAIAANGLTTDHLSGPDISEATNRIEFSVSGTTVQLKINQSGIATVDYWLTGEVYIYLP